jgi:hypothetical protein
MSFAAGFQTGAQAVERGLRMREEDRLKRNLAQESARYDVTEGAYGPGLQENIQQLQGLREQDPAQAPAYDQAIAELTRRQGLTAPDYSVASGAQNFGTRQEARQAAAPMRTEGLSGVYRQAGMIDKADELENRAFEQQRAMAAEERAKAAEARAQQDFANRSTLTGLEINDRTRTAATAKRMDDFNAWRSQNPDADFGAINAEVKRLGMGVDEQFKVASSLTGIGEQEFKASQQRIQKLVKNQGLDGLLKAHKESNDLDPGSHFEVTRGKDGKVSLNRVDTATGQVIQPNVFSGSEAETTAYLNRAAMDPATIIDFTMNLEKIKLGMDTSRAAIRASDATTNLRTQQGQVLSTQAAGNAEAQQIRARYDALSPEDQAGPVGQGLVRQFNMANVKAGATVPLGAAPRETKIDADRAAWLKAEQKLIENDTAPESIEAQRTAFFVRRGYAPAAARQVLEAGVNPATGKPLTRSDVDAYNKTYPQTPVDPGSLPWLPSPEREARRQGLISQIPR